MSIPARPLPRRNPQCRVVAVSSGTLRDAGAGNAVSAVRAIIVIGISAFFFGFTTPPMFANPPWPYTGITLDNATSAVTVDRGSPAYRAGLRSGDVISCLDVRAYNMIAAVPHVAYDGLPIRLCVRRGGVWQPVSLAAEQRPPPGMAYISPWLAALRALVYLIYLIVGCALVIARPSIMSWLLFAYCVGAAPFTGVADGASLSSGQFTALFLLMTIDSSSVAGALALFALVVPERAPPRGWRRAAFVAIAAATAASAVAAVVTILRHDYTSSFGQWSSATLTTITVLIVIARLATMQRSERARFGWAAFAIIFGVIDNSLRTGVLSGSTFWVNVISFTAAYLTVIMPLSLMYAILRRHVIDVRFVLSRGVVYAAITTIVVGLIGFVDWLTSAYLHEARAAMAVDAAVTIALGFVLHRTYGWVEDAVDLLIFRHKHDAEAYLRRVARTLSFAEHEEAIDRALVHDPYEKLELSAAALFRAQGSRFAATRAEGWNAEETPVFDRNDDVVRFLLAERSRIVIADLRVYVAESFRHLGAAPAVAIPIFGRNRLTAFALYGLHRDGTRLDPDEVGVLEHLCEAAAQAYTSVELTRYEGLAPGSLAVETL